MGRSPRHRHAGAGPRHRQPPRRDHPDRSRHPARSRTAAASAGCSAAGGPLPLTPGQTAKILPSGLAAAPQDAPRAVKLAIAAGNQLIDKPYIYGGGHGQPLTQLAAGYDCSGSTSYVLHGAGLFGDYAEDSTGLESYGQAGPGQWITVYANSAPTPSSTSPASCSTPPGTRRSSQPAPEAGRAGSPPRSSPPNTPATKPPATAGSSNDTRQGSDAPTPPPAPRRPRHRPDPGRLRTDRPLHQSTPGDDQHVDVDDLDDDHGDRAQRRPCPRARRHDPERRPRSPEQARGRRRQPDPAGGARALRQPRHQLDRQAPSPAIQDQLAAISLGQARAQALQAAASYGHDSTLQASQVANTGTVVAIAPGQGPAAGWWVIVTRETTTGEGDYAGLPPTDHVTDAQVEHTQQRIRCERMVTTELTQSRHTLASDAQRGRGHRPDRTRDRARAR